MLFPCHLKAPVHIIPVALMAMISCSRPGNTTAPALISFHPDSLQYQALLDGHKEGTVFYSGVVSLLPDSAGEKHSTEDYEEMIIPLTGNGKLQITGHQELDLHYGNIAYIPREKEHRVVNTGKTTLKYIYVATLSDKRQ
ncbi:MAG TPA: cupin domain-containing protein [Bacteroidales bacterium]|nr:cupin domain-containing protein [Bacteroidales bacterium]HSA42202.1 cupin domain-containing protein [Bacteroidales bacterium]